MDRNLHAAFWSDSPSHTENRYTLHDTIVNSSGGKSTQLPYLSKSKDTLTENDSSESHPVKYLLSKCQKLFSFKYT